VTWPHIHRWSEWASEWEECPDGWMGVYEIRTRKCKRGHCDVLEEDPRLVSASPVVLRLNHQYGEAT
jgi:hypothetical protein